MLLRLTKIALFLLFFASLTGCGSKKIVPCGSREACLKDPNCYCWCSQICNWRKKTDTDSPVYIANDRYKKYCYCTQWDYDHYRDNCIEGKNVKEPPRKKNGS